MKRALLAALMLCVFVSLLVAVNDADARSRHRHSHAATHHRTVVKPILDPTGACDGPRIDRHCWFNRQVHPLQRDAWSKDADLDAAGMLGRSPRYHVNETRRAGSWKRSGAWSGFGSLGSRARAYLGETARDLGLPGSLWCADFMNKITGGGTGSRFARSYASYGSPAAPGCIDCIAVLKRGNRGGHVGVVTGYDPNGNPIIVSGNHGRQVGEGVYPRQRVIAWRYAS